MTFTYSATSISTDLSKVRLIIGDTDSDDPLLTDEEINYFLGRYAAVDRAAAECCKAILAAPEVARAIDRTGTGFSASRSQRFQHVRDVLRELQATAGSITRASYTGASKSAKTSLESNSDYTPAAFERNQHDYESASDIDGDD